MKSKGVVYCVTNTRNGKKYVGISIRGAKERWARHVKDAIEQNSDSPFHRAIRKHGPDAFKIRVLRRSDDWKQLCTWERELIAKCRRKGQKLYNLNGGGEGQYNPSPATLAKIHVARKEQWKDPAFRACNTARLKRLWADDVYRAKISAAASKAARRMWTDEEFRAKQLKAMKRRWADGAYRAKMSEARRTTIQRLLAEGYRPGECTAFTEFCRAHGLKSKHVRKRLRKRGLYGLKDINHPIVREVLEKMIAERRTDTVPARRAQSPKTLRPTTLLH